MSDLKDLTWEQVFAADAPDGLDDVVIDAVLEAITIHGETPICEYSTAGQFDLACAIFYEFESRTGSVEAVLAQLREIDFSFESRGWDLDRCEHRRGWAKDIIDTFALAEVQS